MSNQVFKRLFSTTQIQQAGKIWRQKNKLPKLQTAAGPLVDLPDYSFLDGRPTPLNQGQVKRKQEQERLAKEIVNELEYLKRGKTRMSEETQKIIQLKLNSSEAQLIRKSDDKNNKTNKRI